MSRVQYNEDVWDEEYAYLHQGRWDRNRVQVLTSKRGLQALRELREALLALPAKRLIADDFAVPTEVLGCGPVAVLEGDVCVVAAYARHKGLSPAELVGLAEDLCDADRTARWAAESLGLRFTLAWILVELNDEDLEHCTPEERYGCVLGWINRHLREA